VETANWLQHAVFTNSMPELTQSLFNIAKDVVTILTGALQSFAYVETILDGSAKNEHNVCLKFLCVNYVVQKFLTLNLYLMVDVIHCVLLQSLHIIDDFKVSGFHSNILIE